jgi:RNA polymerase sigma factor (sigma-70 family)
MLYGMVRDENDAWDLAQEGFLKAWRSIHEFEGRSSFYTWLYSLTVNLAIDSLRRKGRCVEVELDDAIPCSLPSPRANYQRTEIRQHINAAIAQLSAEHRAVIVLKEIEDLQYPKEQTQNRWRNLCRFQLQDRLRTLYDPARDSYGQVPPILPRTPERRLKRLKWLHGRKQRSRQFNDEELD